MDIFTNSLKEIHKKLIDKEVSVEELVKTSLGRIKETDDEIKSFLTVRTLKELTPEIKAAQKRIDSGNSTILTGIPYSAKDIFVTKNIRTTAGSKTKDGYIPQYSSTVTSRLEEAGAILVGKTNLDAFAHGSSTENSDYFPSRNPWDTSRIPGGSSGGSATSVASLQVPFSVGSETGGSIRHPSALCGITGLKGTYGRVPRYGVVAMGSSLDCPGPMARSAEDAAIIMSVISGQDENDGTSIQEKPLNLEKLSKNDLKGLKIGISEEFLSGKQINPEVAKSVKEGIDKLEELGSEIKPVRLLDPEYPVSVYAIACSSEISSNLARYHGVRFSAHTDGKVDTVYDYFKNSRSIFGFEAKRRQMIGAYTLSTGYYDQYYRKAQKVRTLIRQNFDEIFEKVDVYVLPTTPNTAITIGESATNPLFAFVEDLLLSSSTMAGLPGISVPVGFSKNLPIGMQIIAPQKQEELILEVANVYQQNTDWHLKVPKIKGIDG